MDQNSFFVSGFFNLFFGFGDMSSFVSPQQLFLFVNNTECFGECLRTFMVYWWFNKWKAKVPKPPIGKQRLLVSSIV